MGKLMLRAAVFLLVLFCLVPHSAFAYTYFETRWEDIAWTTRSYSLDLWHYSGGYWQGSDTSGRSIKIKDRQLDASGLKGSLQASQYVQWRAELPQVVNEELGLGNKIRVRTEAGRDLYKDTFCEISGKSEALIYAKPVFNIDPNYSLNSFVSGIKVSIPLVSSAYGYNLYSLYGHLKTNIVGTGRFSSSQPGKVFPPYIHPSMIESSSGRLRRGFSILAGGDRTASDGWSVGLFTLSRGGAVGLHFEFPVRIIFSVERKIAIEAECIENSVRQDDNSAPGGSSGSSSGKQSGSSASGSGRSGSSGRPGSGSGGSNSSEAPGQPRPPDFDIYGARIHRVY